MPSSLPARLAPPASRIALSLALALTIIPAIARAVALTPDVAVSKRIPGCLCSGKPTTQWSPSVAAWGPYVLASWSDNRYRCLGSGTFPQQSYGYSADYGATFKDAGLLAGPSGSVFFGDPAVTVNLKTGDFYITGYRRTPGHNPDGLLGLKGHFQADTFTIDLRVTIAISEAGETYNRAWIAADSISGNVYFAWESYTNDGTEIEFQPCDANLNPLGPSQSLRQMLAYEAAAENPYVAVGPDGELYVAWSIYGDRFAEGHHELVRSNDLGATFGPVQIVGPNEFDLMVDAPGSLRPYGLSDVSMAVDATRGPHRGRVYMAWDESVRSSDAPFGDQTSAFEVENNGTFATATPFTVGGKIRGTASPGDVDYFRFDATAGQVLVIRPDSCQAGSGFRLICQSSSDTSSLGTYHTLAYSLGDGAVIGLPYTGTYYIQDADPGATGSYTFATAFDTPSAGDIALDQRDQVVSWSDDGLTWSTPVRINDSAPGFDGCFPSLVVDGAGRVHCFWMDYRSDPGCGDLSDAYMASSGDGGVTWGVNRRLSDASSYWSFLASCTFYNHGAYQQFAASGNHLYAVFPDARMGDTDVFMDASLHQMVASCPVGGAIPSGQDHQLAFSLTNQGSFDTPLEWRLQDSAGWLTGAVPGLSGSQQLAAGGGTLVLNATFHPAASCNGDSSTVRLITRDPFVPGREDTSTTVVHCAGTAGVGDLERQVLAFLPPRPNPARGTMRFGYSLSKSGFAQLDLFSADGRRIRTLELGIRAAGPHELIWDGADDAGRRVPPGAYFVRLEAEGRTMRRSAILLR